MNILARLILLLWIVAGIPAYAAQWLTYGHSEARQGYNPAETTLSDSTVPSLTEKWQASLSGPVLTQPLLATGVSINGIKTEVVYAADLNGEVRAFRASTGATIWSTNVPTKSTSSCPPGSATINNPQVGVIGTPTIDKPNDRMFLVAGNGMLYALAIGTGLPLPGYPANIMDVANANGISQVFGSPSYDRSNGLLFVETAGLCEDASSQGEVIEINVGTDNTTTPFVVDRWFPTAASGAGGGGMWGPGGAVINSRRGYVYTATGNAFATPENIDYAEHVVKLDYSLNVIGADGPTLTGTDVDFGSTPLLYHPPGCPLLLAVMNKSGKVFIYKAGSISNGPLQTITVTQTAGVGGFIGMVSYDPPSNQLFFGNNQNNTVNLAYKHGLIAMGIRSTCKAGLNWVRSVGTAYTNGPPVIPTVEANGVVYYVDAPDSVVYAFTTSGTQLWNSGTHVRGGIYTAPTVVNGMLLVADYTGKITTFRASSGAAVAALAGPQ